MSRNAQQSVFAGYRDIAYPYKYKATLLVDRYVGGTPSNPNVAEAWLKTKLADKDDLIREKVAEIMVERGISAEEATKEADRLKHLNGFKRDENGLYIEGRTIKAAIKEFANIKWPKRRWGESRKGTRAFFAEHVFVPEDKIYLSRKEPDDVQQRFIHSFRGTGIQLEEVCDDAKITFHVVTDSDEITDEDWAMIWLTGEENGVGAARSQGYGRFATVAWDKVRGKKAAKKDKTLEVVS